jgi:hypothetical protein
VVSELGQLNLFSSAAFSDIQPHIVQQFWDFHKSNPKVFELFREYCHQLRAAGRNQYGAKAVMERIRWHLEVETRGDDFKINNNYSSCYARLLLTQEPAFRSFFHVRSRGSNG